MIYWAPELRSYLLLIIDIEVLYIIIVYVPSRERGHP